MSATIPVYYINLASRPDRRAFMQAQFDRLGIAAERIEAVRSEDVPPDLVAFHRTSRSLWRLGAGDLACGLSHQRCWARMIETGAPAALVLEDDAILTEALLDFLAHGVLQRLDADLVKLETFHTPVKLGSERLQLGGTMLRELCSTQMGAAAYVLSIDAARRSLLSPQRDLMGVDRLLFGRGGLHLLRSRVLQAIPSPCIQLDKAGSAAGVAGSDIETTRRPAIEARRRGPAPHPVPFLELHLDHIARQARLALRDWPALRSRRTPIPFAGTGTTP